MHTSAGDLPADFAVLGLGVTPNAELLADAGVETGAAGAVRVDHRQRTSAAGIWAAGDCADTFHLVSKERVHFALGTVANRTGASPPQHRRGPTPSFPACWARRSRGSARSRSPAPASTRIRPGPPGIEYVVGEVVSTSRASYFPGASEILVRLLFEAARGRLIGGQHIGADRIGKRIDVIAAAITGRLGITDLIDLDLAYAPAVATTWDPFQIAARKAQEQLVARFR